MADNFSYLDGHRMVRRMGRATLAIGLVALVGSAAATTRKVQAPGARPMDPSSLLTQPTLVRRARPMRNSR